MLLKRFRRFLGQTTAPLSHFAKDTRGNTSIIFGLTSIPLAMVASMAVDYSNSVRIKNELQAAADAGVLAAATALATGEDDTTKEEIAEDTFFANLSDNTLSGFAARPTTEVDFPNKEVTLNVQVTSTRMINTLLSDHMKIGVSATAIVDPGNPICMMSLNKTAKEALYLNGTADIVADGCSIHVNSDHEEALRQVGSGQAEADSFCVNGEYAGSNYSPMPEKGCRQENDPLESYFGDDLTDLSMATCDFQSADVWDDAVVSDGKGNGKKAGTKTVLLKPGVYCGDLDITSGDTVILQGATGDTDDDADGVYVFLNGSIDVRGGGTIRNTYDVSDGVTPDADAQWPAETAIILAGDSAGTVEVNGGADVTVRAKSDGSFAGIALAQDPDSVPSKDHVINGGGDVNIDGIVYFPTQGLDIGGNGVIGNNADQFAIMADTIEVNGTGQLEIRIGADYRAAGLPELPEAAERVRLKE